MTARALAVGQERSECVGVTFGAEDSVLAECVAEADLSHVLGDVGKEGVGVAITLPVGAELANVGIFGQRENRLCASHLVTDEFG